jgi:hypothetical protein
MRHEPRQHPEDRVQINRRPAQQPDPVRVRRHLRIKPQPRHAEITPPIRSRHIDLADRPVDHHITRTTHVPRQPRHLREIIPRARRNQRQRPPLQIELPNRQIQRPIPPADHHPVIPRPRALRTDPHQVIRTRTRLAIHTCPPRAEILLDGPHMPSRTPASRGRVVDEFEVHETGATV